MKKTVNLTPAGKAELEQELAELIAQRPAIAERIATARAFGDLSENQEYTDARAEQKTVENRIIEIQEILKNAAIIKAPKKGDSITIGASVIIDMGGKEFTYTLVGPVEANPLEGKISHESPLGKELMGRKAGEDFDFNGKKVKIKSLA
jgi:transcription elongation factor GreA